MQISGAEIIPWRKKWCAVSASANHWHLVAFFDGIRCAFGILFCLWLAFYFRCLINTTRYRRELFRATTVIHALMITVHISVITERPTDILHQFFLTSHRIGVYMCGVIVSKVGVTGSFFPAINRSFYELTFFCLRLLLHAITVTAHHHLINRSAAFLSGDLFNSS